MVLELGKLRSPSSPLLLSSCVTSDMLLNFFFFFEIQFICRIEVLNISLMGIVRNTLNYICKVCAWHIINVH